LTLLSTIAASPLSLSDIAQRDLLQELIADRRSPNTRRTYTKALVDFFMQVANAPPTPELVGEFLKLDRYQANHHFRWVEQFYHDRLLGHYLLA
jgi:integrase/recombinase XerC